MHNNGDFYNELLLNIQLLNILFISNTLHTLFFGAIAQLGEHLLCKQEVVGSIPTSSTRYQFLSLSINVTRYLLYNRRIYQYACLWDSLYKRKKATEKSLEKSTASIRGCSSYNNRLTEGRTIPYLRSKKSPKNLKYIYYLQNFTIE